MRRRRCGAWLSLAFVLASVSGPAWSGGGADADADTGCPAGVLAAMADHFGALDPDDPDAIVAGTCKVWPYDEAITLAVVAQALTLEERGDRSLRQMVAMVSTGEASVLAGYETLLQEDAALELGGDAFRLDTARYDLAPGQRAFGVVIRSSARGASCPDGGRNDALTLFVRDGRALRPVFATYLEGWERVEGEPCAWREGEAIVVDRVAMVVAVEPAEHREYADLRVIAHVQRETTVPRADGPADVETTSRRASRVVRHDGNRYDGDPLEGGFFWSTSPRRER